MEMLMDFETLINKSKPKMYRIYNSYRIDGYDSDDLFQETVLWVLRDWDKINLIKNCKVETAILKRAKWVCSFFNYYEDKPTSSFDEKLPITGYEITDYDMIHLFMKAKRKLSPRAFAIFFLKIKPTKTIINNMNGHVPSRRDIQMLLKIANTSYKNSLKEIRDFLYEEGIHPNKRR
jgi:hypothetical protein